MNAVVYDNRFYSQFAETGLRSALRVLKIVFNHLQPQSVIDLGCGRGAWLRAAEILGSEQLTGVEGPWVSQDQLLTKQASLITADLETEFATLSGNYDLCICLEVAEHLRPEVTGEFVNTITSLSPVVLFSAAIPYQGGTDHKNEKWQCYWVDRFEERGFDCFDIFRPELWDDETVDWWYRQNAFLIVSRDNSGLNRVRLKQAERPIYNVVHPANIDNFARKLEFYTQNKLGCSIDARKLWHRDAMTLLNDQN